MRALRSLLGLTLIAAACGPSTPADPYADARMQRKDGDYEAAARNFELALAMEPASSERFRNARVMYVESVAHFDPERATRDAIDLLGEPWLTEVNVVSVADALREEGALERAQALLVATVERFPRSDLLDAQYTQVLNERAKDATAADLRQLSTTGYVGGTRLEIIVRPGAISAAEGADPVADEEAPQASR